MICCKIITNLNQGSSEVNKLFQKLFKKGDYLVSAGYIYFCDSEFNTDKNTVAKILRSCGFKDFYIDVYTEQNPPKENDEINAWLCNQLLKLNYNMFEQQSQEVFRNISKGLDVLEVELEKIINKENNESHKQGEEEKHDR